MFKDITIQEFEQYVEEAVTALPEEFKKELENIDIIVEVWPTIQDLQTIRAHHGAMLFGLYRGVPKTKRGLYYSGVLPDKITIFTGPILSISRTIEDVKDQIKKTVIHEIGHYFGLSEKEITNAEQKL